MADILLQNGTDGLFDILGDIFVMQTHADAKTAERRDNFDALQTAFGLEFSSPDWASAFSTCQFQVTAEESSPSDVTLALRSLAEQAVIERVDEAVNLTSKTLDLALYELTSQMIERSQSLKKPTTAVTVAADAGNTGDAFIVATKRRTDGADNPQQFAEVVSVAAVVSPGSVSASLVVTSDAVRNGLAPEGFGGSGLNGYLGYFSISTGLVGSGGLNPFTTSASTLPGNWIANVGTLGTAVLSGLPQVSTITITGTPSSGTYRIQCATTSLGTQSTINLPYNATASQVQAAIMAMSGFSRVSVSATGTAPDYVHSISFYGLRESVTVSVVNSTNSGSFAVATPTAYASPSLGSSPIVLVSDGSTLVSVSHLLTHLFPRTAYSVNAWLALDAVAASGVVEISLTNGVGGAILTDDSGNNLSLTVNATSLTTTYQGAAKLTASVPIFMTPKTLPASTYLRIRCSTTLPTGRKVFIENPIIAPAVQLYTGGPFIGIFSGPTGPKSGDLWTITTTNDYAGNMSWAMERNFRLRELGLMIPHASSPTITDFTRAPEDAGGGLS